MTDLRAAEIRYRVDPADLPAEKAARRQVEAGRK
jgi:hypothetical protein